jgi:transposase
MMHGALPAAAVSRVYLYCGPVDMRRSFDGLLRIVQSEFERDIQLGDLFVFINKRADRLKALWWDGDGLAIFMKRLESGTFQRPVAAESDPHLLIDRVQLGLLLGGIELTSVKRRKRYQPQQRTSKDGHSS